jgi:alkyl hydroperoxide reductase subunit AhpC
MCKYQFQIGHLDKLILINKNWPSNLHLGCLKPFDFTSVCEVELYLIGELNTKFKEEV